MKMQLALLLLAATTLLAGCFGRAQNPVVITDDYYFPETPAKPLAQYVKSFSGPEDIVRKPGFLDKFLGLEEKDAYKLLKPFSVATWKDRIYVTDSFGTTGVHVFDLENKSYYVLGQQRGVGRLSKPIHIFIDDEGYKYFSDLVEGRVLVYGPNDEFVRFYGGDKSFRPVSCVSYGDEVFILDIMKDEKDITQHGMTRRKKVRRDQIVVLDKKSGKELRRMGQHGVGKDGLMYASFLAVDRNGDLYISDCLNYRVLKIDREGNVLTEFGKNGDGIGQFAQMKNLAIDRNGLIHVVDAAAQVVQVFDNAGTPLFIYGGARAAVGALNLPSGICIDYHNVKHFEELYGSDFKPEYLMMVTNQLGDTDKLMVYAYGQKEGLDYPSVQEVVTLDKEKRELQWKMVVEVAK